jgi:predicted dehydrogenase
MAIEGTSQTHQRILRLGMVGGGRDAFIGGVHRIASRIDGHFNLVAGAFSSSPEKSIASGEVFGIASDRNYGSYLEMAKREARLKNGIDAVAIVTPNHMHYPIAREFLKRGIHVICDKPLTHTLPDAKKLVTAAEKSDALFILTHNYTGYPMVRQAREMIANGVLGKIRLVNVQYAQDWLSEAVDNKQSAWRTDPNQSGAGGSTGDIGTHAFNLANFVSGLTLDTLAADLDSFVAGRTLDDNAHVMMRFEGGAKGMLWCSQVAPGSENGLKIQIYGEKGGIQWGQEDPNYLYYAPLGEPMRKLTRGGPETGDAAARMTRIPGGHPEGYLEGFANIYSEAATAIRATQAGQPVPSEVVYPTVQDGLIGMQFVDACVRSSIRNGAWVKFA